MSVEVTLVDELKNKVKEYAAEMNNNVQTIPGMININNRISEFYGAMDLACKLNLINSKEAMALIKELQNETSTETIQKGI